MVTASSRAVEAWIRRRKERDPVDERSRSSRRSKGLRGGDTVEDLDVRLLRSWFELSLADSVEGGGTADGCGADVLACVDVGGAEVIV